MPYVDIGLDGRRTDMSTTTETGLLESKANWESFACAFYGLMRLAFSINVFKPLDTTQTRQPLANIRSLILTDCRLRWDEVSVSSEYLASSSASIPLQVNSLSALFPNLVELGLCKNQITAIESISFRNLQSLDLEGNPIVDFANVSVLSGLERYATKLFSCCSRTQCLIAGWIPSI